MFREPGEAFQPINVVDVPIVDQTVLKAYKTVPIEPAGIEINSQSRLLYSRRRGLFGQVVRIPSDDLSQRHKLQRQKLIESQLRIPFRTYSRQFFYVG